MKALLKKVLCGIVFLSATTATARIVVPLHELDGRCYGYLYITDETVNFAHFDPSGNVCRGMRYTKMEKIPTADGKDYSLAFYLKHPTKRCPYMVIEIFHGSDSDWGALVGYESMKSFNVAHSGQASGGELGCIMYRMDKKSIDEMNRRFAVQRAKNRRHKKQKR